MLRRTAFIMMALWASGWLCAADSIRLGDKTLDGVYIRESDALYYVQIPWDGTVTVAWKADVQAGDVVITEDSAARAVLLAEWNRRNAELRGPSPQVVANTASAEAKERGAVADRGPRAGRVKLRNIPLGDALKVTLRPMGLDYRVEPGYIRIGTPRELRSTASEPLETRYYPLQASNADTLPKVVVQTPSYSAPGSLGGSGYGSAYGGYGAASGTGAAQMGGYGAAGGYGQGGMGMQGGGYGMGGGGGHFSNISDLFSTIDDRLVGETPAVIGMGGLSYYPAQRR